MCECDITYELELLQYVWPRQPLLIKILVTGLGYNDLTSRLPNQMLYDNPLKLLIYLITLKRCQFSFTDKENF